MPIRLTLAPDAYQDGHVLERCCFCRALTSYWYARKDVAVCESCGRRHKASDVPSKERWCAAERASRRA
jgi:hypothetical protein